MAANDELDAALDAEAAAMASGGNSPADPNTAAASSAGTSPVNDQVATPAATQPDAAAAAGGVAPPASQAAPAGTSAGAPPPVAPQQSPVRDLAQQLGINPAQYADDAALMTAIAASHQTIRQQAAQLEQLAQYGNMYLAQNRGGANAAAPVQQQAPPDPLARYKGPEWNPRWADAIERTPEGRLQVKPGADPAILPKFLAYQEHRQNVADQFLQDPAGFLQPLVSHFVQEQANQLVQNQLSQFQENTYVQNWMQQNAGWIWQQDASGRPIVNPATGQPIPSQAAVRFRHHLGVAEAKGIADPRVQEEWARMALLQEIQQMPQQTNAAVAQGQQQRQAVIQSMNRQPTVSGSHVGPDNTGAVGADQQNSQLSLREQLMAAMKAEGVTNDAFAA